MLELPINLLKWSRKLKVESSYLPQASHSKGDFLVLRIANAGTALLCFRFFLPVHLTQQFSLFWSVSSFNAFSIIYYRFWKVIICVKTHGRLILRDTQSSQPSFWKFKPLPPETANEFAILRMNKHVQEKKKIIRRMMIKKNYSLNRKWNLSTKRKKIKFH